jgi:hypothetical protein
VAAKHRPRYEAAIRRIKIDEVLIGNEAAKMSAARRAEEKQKALDAYEVALADWQRIRTKNPLSIRKPPKHPFERERVSKDVALPAAYMATGWSLSDR